MTDTASIGHNSISGKQLQSIIDRIERMESEKKAIAEDIKEIYSEAKCNGFDAATIREIIKIRKLDENKRLEKEAVLETYLNALGMLYDTPLGKFAVDKVA